MAETPEPDVEVESIADETARKAQRVVAAYAEDAEECKMLWEMLGIAPEERVDA